MEGNHHYFFAVKLPEEAKEFIHQWLIDNKSHFPFKRWVHSADYHITLAFLGFKETEWLEKAIDQVGQILEAEKSFTLSFNQLGTFGSMNEPRIFWVDVHNSIQLTDIQKKVYNQCIHLGFSLDKKPFRPHITLARKWNGQESFQKSLLEQFRLEPSFSFTVNQVVLYETHVDQTPKYKEHHVINLKLLD